MECMTVGRKCAKFGEQVAWVRKARCKQLCDDTKWSETWKQSRVD